MTKSKEAEVEDVQREAQVLELRKAGLTFVQIGERLGYADHTGALKAFRRAMAKTLQQPANEYRELELARLDELWARFYPKALAGQKMALDGCLDIIDKRAKLLGLYAPTQMRLMVSDETQREIEALAAQLGVLDPTKAPLELEAAPE